MRTPRHSELNGLLALMDEAFDRRSWHGPNFRSALRGVSAEQAAWRPHPDRHNIWELVVHAAYWKYMVRRRLLGEPGGTFPEAGSNWFARPASPRTAGWQAAWRRDVQLLRGTHAALRATVASLGPSDMRNVAQWRERAHMIRGIAAHDLYHTGQIQLLKRLRRSAPSTIRRVAS